MSDVPELRASDADREHTAETLRHAAAEGRLTVDELDERLARAFGARTGAELERLVADVVVPGSGSPARVSAASAPMPVRPGPGGTRFLLSLMSGRDRRGRWRLAPKVLNVNVMGGSDLDLNDAELSAPVTTLRIVAIMGGADVRVPEGLDVRVSELALMGGNDVRLGSAPPAPGSPVLHLRLFALMGGIHVRRGRRLSRAERRAERRAR